MCGEKDKAKEMGATTKGSPPRMRGKACDAVPGLVVRRITPACAGKSRWLCKAASQAEDHPRVCGEKTMRFIIASTVSGSPPRMRGKARGASLLCQHLRITPACAGKSKDRLPACSSSEDHPRVCGEKMVDCALFMASSGSPPRVRGKVET